MYGYFPFDGPFFVERRPTLFFLLIAMHPRHCGTDRLVQSTSGRSESQTRFSCSIFGLWARQQTLIDARDMS